MRRFRLVALLLSLALLALCPATAPAADPQPDLAGNAAVQYWQAFALLPTLNKDQEKLLAEWDKVPLEGEALKLIAASHNSLMYLHRGARLERCDWGLDYNDGQNMLLPQLAKARDLARLAALHARHEFEQGNWKAGRADATAMMTLARHTARDPVMISQLVRYAIEGMAIDVMTPYVPELKVPYARAVAAYEALPPAPTLEQTVVFEKKFMVEWLIRQLKETEQAKPGSWRELWKNVLGPGEGPNPPQLPEAVKRVDTLDQAVKLTEDMLPAYDELARLVARPKDEFDAQYSEFAKKTKVERPLAGLILPAVDKVLAKERRHQARMAMLLAAIAVAEGGPDKLKDIKDPFGTGPFEYRALDKGFELKSKLLYDGQPVTLTVGQRKKKMKE